MTDTIDVYPTETDEQKSDVKHVWWMYPKVGTCGEAMDVIGICLCRVMSVPTIYLRFDAQRSVWSIGKIGVASDRFVEIATVPAEALENPEENEELEAGKE